MSVAPAGVALTGNTPGPESKYRLAPNRNNQWPSRLQILSDVLRQEADMVAGHGVFRYTGLISVSADTETELEAAIAAIQQAAIQASLETRLLVGQQASAFVAAALPLCRGI